MISEAEHQQIKLLELKCKRPVEHLLAGEYRSVFKGQGIEFEDVRPYQPGDDVRMMDWKITARTGTPHIKRYIEEREQFFYLIVDLSASLLHDHKEHKRKLISEIGALITLSAIQNNDCVALILFSDKVEHVIPPGKGRQHARRIIESLLTFNPENQQTSFKEVLSQFGHMAHKHSVAFVLSDFLSDDYLDELSALSLIHDVNVVQIKESQKDLEKLTDIVLLNDAEEGKRRFVDLSSRTEPAHLSTKDLHPEFSERGISLMEITPNDDPVEVLNHFFRTRQRRIADETGG